MGKKDGAAAAGGKGGKVERKVVSVLDPNFGKEVTKKADDPKPAAGKAGKAAGGKKAAGAGRAAEEPKGGKGGKSSYLGDLDLPPSDSSDNDDSDDEDSEEERLHAARSRRAALKGEDDGSGIPFHANISDRDYKKKGKKEEELAAAMERAKLDALKEDDNAFSVSIPANQMVDDGVAALSRDIKIPNFSISAKGKELLTNTSLTIVNGRKYGLVGPNGKGKSTLLRLLARRQLPVPAYIDLLMVEQEVVADEKTALEAVVAADEELTALRKEQTELEKLINGDENKEGADGGKGERNGSSGRASGSGRNLRSEEEDEEGADSKKKDRKKDKKKKDKKKGKGGEEEEEEDGDKEEDLEAAKDAAAQRLNEIYERIQEMGGSSAEAKASKILNGLGFTDVMQKRSTKSFSGGWRMRISLARALFIQPTLLLLDEPTNHLDLRAVFWLEEYLSRWKKTLIVVSHDRDFLNTICTDIVHLHDCKLHFYRGNYDSFAEMYEQKRTEQNRAYEKFEKQMRAAKASGSKANQEKVRASAKQAAEKAKGSKKGKKGGDDDDDKPAGSSVEPLKKWQDYSVRFYFPQPTELTPPLLQLIDVGFSYPGRDDFALKDINVGVDMGTRVAIVGPNGAGKSTLLNLLAGDLQPCEGEFRRSHKLRIGRYSQHFVDVLQMDENPVQYLLRKHPDAATGPSKSESMRAMLGRFGLFSHNHLTPIVKLSGGQKARVVFTSISLSNPHILMLDEPTNHLDMESIDALADALDEFEGGVVLVSHDSRLISRVCDDEERSEIWEVDEGTVTKYNGDFGEFREDLMKEIAAEVDA